MANLLTERGWPFIFLPTTGVLSRWEDRAYRSYKAHKTNMFYNPDGLPHPLGGKMGASNMDHITDPPLPLPKGGGSKQPTISYSSPFGGIEGGYQYESYYRTI